MARLKIQRSTMEILIETAGQSASQDITREWMTRVYVDPTHVMASDGHRAVFLSHKHPEAVGIYCVDGKPATGTFRHDVPETFRKACGEQVGSPAKLDVCALPARGILDLENTIRVFAKSASVSLKFTNGRLELHALETLTAKQKEKFVHAGTVIVDLGACAVAHDFQVNARYLLDAIETLGNRLEPMTITKADFSRETVPADPIVLHQEDSMSCIRIDGPRGFACIMPMRM